MRLANIFGAIRREQLLVYIVGYLLLVAFLALQHWSLSGLPKYWLFVAILLCFVFHLHIGTS